VLINLTAACFLDDPVGTSSELLAMRWWLNDAKCWRLQRVPLGKRNWRRRGVPICTVRLYTRWLV